MRIKRIHLKSFKRFTDTTVCDIPKSVRLVVLAGPNGSGKSSIFDGIHTWHMSNGAPMAWDATYGAKAGSLSLQNWQEHVTMDLHDDLPEFSQRRKMVYLRTAFRNQSDFLVREFKVAAPMADNKINRMIDNDLSVQDNYIRLVMQSIQDLYGDSLPPDMPRTEVRDRLIGQVRVVMQKVFPDLILTGVGAIGAPDNRAGGTFYFEKGTAKEFLYKNLSAGEKSAFDLLLDAVLKSQYYDDSVWCIDEPEAHLSTQIQSNLLVALLDVIPSACQLWIASHSIGLMSQARKLMQDDPGSVAFIDMFDVDFDSTVVLRPVVPNRQFWSRTLNVAIGELADLVAPERVILCEGRPTDDKPRSRAEFDAACYQTIFAEEFPETDFLSVGNSADVRTDRLEVGRAIQTLVTGTQVVRLIDRDLMTDAEIDALRGENIRVLTRRHIEAYLLDPEVIAAYCAQVQQPDRAQEAIDMLRLRLQLNTEQRQKSPDDVKSAASEYYTSLRRLLQLTRSGSTFNAFARESLAPLVKPGMAVYTELKNDIFG